jgi:hypothetical protein
MIPTAFAILVAKCLEGLRRRLCRLAWISLWLFERD